MSKDITKAEYEIIDVFYTSSTATRSHSNAEDKLQRERCVRGRLCVLMCKVMCSLHINMHAKRERERHADGEDVYHHDNRLLYMLQPCCEIRSS